MLTLSLLFFDKLNYSRSFERCNLFVFFFFSLSLSLFISDYFISQRKQWYKIDVLFALVGFFINNLSGTMLRAQCSLRIYFPAPSTPAQLTAVWYVWKNSSTRGNNVYYQCRCFVNEW